MSNGKVSWSTRVPFDDLVLLVVIVGGMAVAIVPYLAKLFLPPPVVGVALGMAIAALVFRFLGGIGPDTTFGIGALKVSGSLAALLGSALVLTPELPKLDPEKILEPHPEQWVAVNVATARRESIKALGEAVSGPTQEDPLKNVPLQIVRAGDALVVYPEAESTFSLGRLNRLPDELVQRTLEVGDTWITEPLPAGAVERIESLGLTLTTTRYAGGYSAVEVLDDAGQVWPARIQGRGAKVNKLGTRWLLLAVVEVSHQADPPYAKFLVAQITTEAQH